MISNFDSHCDGRNTLFARLRGYVGETDRLFREVGLAGVLEAAAQALRSGRGLIGVGAGDVVREIWHSYPNAGLKGGEQDQRD
jgi:hypothetical protein